jgi:hypothetical protein
MPGHGNHWEALYDLDYLVDTVLPRDINVARELARVPCRDVVNGTDRAESVKCLRHGGAELVNQILFVSDTPARLWKLFSGYPVSLAGIRYPATLVSAQPWEYGLEGWVTVDVGPEALGVTYFDTLFFLGRTPRQTGARFDVSLSALAYSLEPITTRSFEITEGVMWEIERKRLLEEGESEAEASKPVVLDMTQAAIYLPRSSKEAPDEAQIQGVVEALTVFEHDGQRVYRVEMVVARPGDFDFRLPVFASERVLKGRVPAVGDSLQGVVWLQGETVGG